MTELVVSGGVVRFERQSSPPGEREAAAELRIHVRDVQGRVVWRGTSVESSTGVALWDLTDRRGEPVPAGVYFAVQAGTSPGEAARVLVIR